MDETFENFPEHCWEMILSKLDDHVHWEQLSLVSKMFLSITNHLRVSLRVFHPSTEILSNQLRRFPNLKKIDLSDFRGAHQDALSVISQSPLDIEELNISSMQNPPVLMLKEICSKRKNLKVFRCSDSYLTDHDLSVLADYLTSVEELDISRPYPQNITDKGIVALALKLKRLKTINLTGITKISDLSLLFLSNHCMLLTEVVLHNCLGVTQMGISYLMENSPNYNSLILTNGPFVIKTPLNYSQHLCIIELCRVTISDDLLYEMAKANLPLKTFHLSFCTNFTIDGVSSVLKANQSLQSLALNGTYFLTDENVTHLSQYIPPKLTSINLGACSKLTNSSFITIALACPLINNIAISISLLSKEDANIVNPMIKSASFTCTTLQGLLYICPNLQVLNVTSLPHSHELDIAYVLSCCPQLRHLTIVHNAKLIFSGDATGEMACGLESLVMKKSYLDDRVLEMVGKSCPRLLNLDLEGCISVTERGLRIVMENCKKLKYVNLDWCMKVSRDALSRMVASGPSLKEIVTPYSLVSNDIDEASCLLRQGYSGAYDRYACEDLSYYLLL